MSLRSTTRTCDAIVRTVRSLRFDSHIFRLYFETGRRELDVGHTQQQKCRRIWSYATELSHCGGGGASVGARICSVELETLTTEVSAVGALSRKT